MLKENKSIMLKVKHKFLEHVINQKTKTLIVGTFNPEAKENDADFFYGRGRNYLWRLLTSAYGEDDLKGKPKSDKLSFIRKYSIDFIDLISEIEVDEGQEANYYDGYIDNKVTSWRDIVMVIDSLKGLKRICFTRRTFSDIPNMKKRIEQIQSHCESKGIIFQLMTTPARFYSENKQIEWTQFLQNDIR